MFNGQWFGKYEGSWGGSATESPLGSMFGVSTFVFLASGSLTVKTDSWLPIDANYYPFVSDPCYETASIESLYSVAYVDHQYGKWIIDNDYSQVSISYDYSVFSIESIHNTMTVDSAYSAVEIDSGYNTWQLN